jgi:1-acyl-sn-glycerol-3-phosphate acyltransferase
LNERSRPVGDRVPSGNIITELPSPRMRSHARSISTMLALSPRLFVHFKWVSKVENFRVPCIGWNMRLNGYVPLRRGDKASIVEMLRACDRILGEGNSVMMFPEGTRSPTGRLRAFKTGAFEIALRNRRPLLPILIEGTADALPKRGFVLRGRHPLRITVLEPWPYERFAGLGPEALAAAMREHVAEHLGEARVEPLATGTC